MVFFSLFIGLRYTSVWRTQQKQHFYPMSFWLFPRATLFLKQPITSNTCRWTFPLPRFQNHQDDLEEEIPRLQFQLRPPQPAIEPCLLPVAFRLGTADPLLSLRIRLKRSFEKAKECALLKEHGSKNRNEPLSPTKAADFRCDCEVPF